MQLEWYAPRPFKIDIPSGFVFSLASSGTSLATETLAALPCASLAATPAVASALDSGDATPDELRGAIRELGADRSETRFVVSCDPLHATNVATIERAFPNVPWAFIYGNPLEVLAAHERSPRPFLSVDNAPTALGIEVAAAAALPGYEYAARVLGRICDMMNRRASPYGILVHSEELPGAVYDRIAPHFGIVCSTHDRAAILSGQEPARELAIAPSPAVRHAARHFVAASYAALEARRYRMRAEIRA